MHCQPNVLRAGLMAKCYVQNNKFRLCAQFSSEQVMYLRSWGQGQRLIDEG